jgi:hypothetical protein
MGTGLDVLVCCHYFSMRRTSSVLGRKMHVPVCTIIVRNVPRPTPTAIGKVGATRETHGCLCPHLVWSGMCIWLNRTDRFALDSQCIYL